MDFHYFFRADFVTMAAAILTWAGAAWARRKQAQKEEYKRQRNAEIQAAFVRSMATNHLPHIQDALYKIAGKVGVELPPAPPIEWVDLNGKK